MSNNFSSGMTPLPPKKVLTEIRFILCLKWPQKRTEFNSNVKQIDTFLTSVLIIVTLETNASFKLNENTCIVHWNIL